MSTDVVAFVPDLLDRSRFEGLGARFVRTLEQLEAAQADVAVADLSREGALEALATCVAARKLGFAPHVEGELLVHARSLGIEAYPRSRFFRQLRGLVCPAEEGDR